MQTSQTPPLGPKPTPSGPTRRVTLFHPDTKKVIVVPVTGASGISSNEEIEKRLNLIPQYKGFKVTKVENIEPITTVPEEKPKAQPPPEPPPKIEERVEKREAIPGEVTEEPKRRTRARKEVVPTSYQDELILSIHPTYPHKLSLARSGEDKVVVLGLPMHPTREESDYGKPLRRALRKIGFGYSLNERNWPALVSEENRNTIVEATKAALAEVFNLVSAVEEVEKAAKPIVIPEVELEPKKQPSLPFTFLVNEGADSIVLVSHPEHKEYKEGLRACGLFWDGKAKHWAKMEGGSSLEEIVGALRKEFPASNFRSDERAQTPTVPIMSEIQKQVGLETLLSAWVSARHEADLAFSKGVSAFFYTLQVSQNAKKS